jgi:hypothetical protein
MPPWPNTGPYNPNSPPPKSPPSSGKGWKFVLGGLGGVFLFCLLSCCGGGYVFSRWVGDAQAAKTLAVIETSWDVEPFVGKIESLGWNLSASVVHPDDNAFVYDVVGSKASGTLIVYESERDDSILRMQFRDADGEVEEVQPKRN